MKTRSLLSLLIVLLVPALSSAGAPDFPETSEHRDARMAWFREARFGLFIHWGLYAALAGGYKGDQIRHGYAEWLMFGKKIPVAAYADYAEKFIASKFDADAWVALAKRAGMKYIIITTKHHEGFAMFRTAASRFNIVDATPFRRDPIAELADACRRQGIRLGFYYSQNLDWSHAGGGRDGVPAWDPAQEGNADTYVNTVAIPQIRELFSQYGADTPAVMWWDIAGGTTDGANADRIYKMVRELRPDVIMNNRLGGGYKGDIATPEQTIPATGFPGRDWESCMTMNTTWGYNVVDHDYKSSALLIRTLIDVASKGGNYLLNVGPDAEGAIPPEQIERLEQIGEWLRTNGEAIYGTQPNPFEKMPEWGRITRKGDSLYLHIFYWPKNGKVTVPLRNAVKNVRILSASGPTALTAENTADGLVITLPASAPAATANVVAFEVQGSLDPAPRVPAKPSADGAIRLPGVEAELLSKEENVFFGFESGDTETHIGYWSKLADYARWGATVSQAGEYEIILDYAASDLAAGSEFVLTVGDQKLDGVVCSTGGYSVFKKIRVGTVHIAQTGDLAATLQATKLGYQTRLFNLRALTLVPVGNSEKNLSK